MEIFRSFLVLVFLMSLLLFGCSSNSNDKNVIASEKTLPSDFYEIAFERETTPYFQYLLRKTVNQSEFEQAWDFYEFDDAIPNIDFTEKEVFFIGVYESGSCPYKLENIELSSDNKTMTVPLSEPENDCTTDASPRTFVIQLDKGNSIEIENVVIVQSGIETDVSVEN